MITTRRFAACRLGERRLLEVVETYSLERVKTAFDAIMRRTEQRFRRAIEEIPDGEYQFTDVMDGDGIDTYDIPIKVRIEVHGDRIKFDFDGTSPQVPGNINVTMNATQASVCYALKALLDPEVPSNQGILDVVDIEAEPGTLLNGSFPAPVPSRAHTCQRIIDVVLGALANALPDRVVAAANGANITAVFAGTDPRTGSAYLYLETLGGGMSARPSKDGKDGVQVHITNTSNLPVEAIEMEYPLQVEEYSLVRDSGGAGQYRGGMGLRRVVRPVDHDCVFNGVGERFRQQPWGLFGGEPGASGQFQLREANSETRRLADKPGEVFVDRDQAIIVETPGSGGYGPPQERDPELVDADRRSGKFSSQYLARHYGASTIDNQEDK